MLTVRNIVFDCSESILDPGIICAHGIYAAPQPGRSLGMDNLLVRRLIPGFRYDGPVARARALAS
jgi:hypothetical protein